MSIYAPPSTGMVVEPVVVLVLHCSRCNKPFTEYETAGAVYWPSHEVIESAFAAAGSEYDGWVKLGGRYLCGDGCWRRTADGGLVEAGPLSVIDEAVVLRERAGYALAPETDAAGGVGGVDGDAPGGRLEAAESAAQR